MDRILTPAELASRYQDLTEATLSDWRYKGKGPKFFRAGKRVFYREAAVLAWEREQEEAQDAKRAS